MPDRGYRPSPENPLLILAMDHRASFGRSLFGVKDDRPDAAELAAMEAAKRLIYAGLARALPRLPGGRAGVLVDERYGQPVVQAARSDGVLLAVPVERSGRDWFELEWGEDWLAHVTSSRADFAKVLVRDNPAFPGDKREQQLRELREVSDALAALGVPLLYELLVPATEGQLAAAFNPPQGTWTWNSGYPSRLQAFWQNGSSSSLILQGAVMAFESNQGLAVDGVPGKEVWTALLKAVAANQQNPNGYTYALASEGNPEKLTVWHDGRVIMKSLANTGIAAAPTTLGTAAVYLKYYYQVMKGKNPDGSKYADPVYYVSYFRAGEAVHYFPRGSYGYPQSLGCVELPWSSAKFIWKYLTYGTLVTVAPGSLTP